jgi:hypothetical protein
MFEWCKRDGHQRQGLPGRQRQGCGADQAHLRGAPGRREHHLDEVKPQRRGGVEIEVGVMDPVKAPQQRHLVGQHVPYIQRVVEQ